MVSQNNDVHISSSCYGHGKLVSVACNHMRIAELKIATRYDCRLASQATNSMVALCLPCTSFLFMLRVYGVFRGCRIIIAVFGLLWVSTLGAITQPFTIHRERALDPALDFCLTQVEKFSTFGLIAVAIFDTAVFAVISMRCISCGMAESWKERTKSFFCGKGIGNVSRLLLQTGQLYYLLVAIFAFYLACKTNTISCSVSIGITLMATVILLVPSVPAIIKCCVTFPGAAIQNSMACRVFRLLRQGMLDDSPVLCLTDGQEFYDSQPAPRVDRSRASAELKTPMACHLVGVGPGSIV